MGAEVALADLPDPDATDRPVLNPFPFRGLTIARLAMLLAATAAAAVSLGVLAFMTGAGGMAPLTACVEAVFERTLPSSAAVLAMEGEAAIRRSAELRAGVLACVHDSTDLPIGFWPSCFLLATLAAASVAYAVETPVKIRRAALRMPPAEVRALVEPRLRAIMEEMAISQPTPQLYWAPLDGSVSAFVFGDDRRPRLAVSLGLVARLAERSDIAEAVLAHELAHIANRDITQARASRASFIGFVCACGPLLALATVFGPEKPTIAYVASQFLRFGALVLLLFAGRAAVLRVRERLADLRAGGIARVRDGLGLAFAPAAAAPRSRLLDWVFSQHPARAMRKAGLTATDDLFASQFADAWLYGFMLPPLCILSQIMFQALLFDLVLEVALSNVWLFAFALIAPLVPPVILFASALVGSAWRTAFAEALGVPVRLRLVPLAGAAACGVVAGFYGAQLGGAAFAGIGDVTVGWLTMAREWNWWHPIATGIAFFVLFAASFWAIRRSAASWAPRLAARNDGARLKVLPTALATLPMIALLPVGVIATACSMFIATLAPQPDGEGMDQSLSIGLGLLGFVIFNPLTPLALFFLITGPIVAAGVRPGPAIAPWVLLRGRLDAPCAAPVAPTRAMLIGLVWGSTVLVLWRHAGLGAFFGGSGTEVLVLYAALLAGAAAVAAAASPAWRFEHGLLALVAAALPSALAFEGMAPVAALGFAWTLVTVGFVFAAPLATLGAALGDLRRRSGAAARGAFRVGS